MPKRVEYPGLVEGFSFGCKPFCYLTCSWYKKRTGFQIPDAMFTLLKHISWVPARIGRHYIGNTCGEVALIKEIPYNMPHVFNQRSVLSEKAAFPHGVGP